MLTVEGLIGDLLIQHNCVVVPGFGGFVAQRVAAQLDTAKGTMLPPRKSVLFNRQLINNDGLLVSAYAQQKQISYTASQEQVNETIAFWDTSLKSGQRIAIDRVGFLYLDAERNLCFEQDRFFNLLLESYGLGPVHFVSASDVAAKSTIEVVHELVKQTEAIPATDADSEVIFTSEPIVPVLEVVAEAPIIPLAQKKPNKTWRYVAAACLLPVAFYSFWIPVKTDVLESGILSLHDFNPFYREVPAKYQPNTAPYTVAAKETKRQLEHIPENVSTYSYELDEETYVPVKVGTSTATIVVTPEPVQSSEALAKSGTYIIVGSYSTRENAQKLVDELRVKGIAAQILEKDGKIRVSAGSGADFNTLSPPLKAAGLEPWLLK